VHDEPVRRIAAIGIVLAAAALPAVLASGATPAGAAPSTWTQDATCPVSGLAVVLRGSEQVHATGPAADRHWTVGGTVTATAGHATATYTLSYQGESASGAGGTEVTGRSVEIAPGGAPFAVDGTAYLAPDGFLGRAVGTTASICGQLGG